MKQIHSGYIFLPGAYDVIHSFLTVCLLQIPQTLNHLHHHIPQLCLRSSPLEGSLQITDATPTPSLTHTDLPHLLLPAPRSSESRPHPGSPAVTEADDNADMKSFGAPTQNPTSYSKYSQNPQGHGPFLPRIMTPHALVHSPSKRGDQDQSQLTIIREVDCCQQKPLDRNIDSDDRHLSPHTHQASFLRGPERYLSHSQFTVCISGSPPMPQASCA